MTIEEAAIYVDEVLGQLVAMNVLSPERYGRMNEDQREQLVKAVKQKSEKSEE